MTQQPDVVVVGGGIAGSALAAKVAGSGLRVLVLERQEEFRDRVRGEAMMPWGVAEAQRLGVDRLLLDVGGGFIGQSVGYDETIAPSDVAALPLSMFVDGVPGFLAVGHPQASDALAQHAASSGATVLRGVGQVDVTAGEHPRVRYDHGGTTHEVRPRIIIGADGRQSAVRKQVGIELQETTATVMLSGMLVSELHDWPVDQATLGSCGDVHYLVFPRPGGIARLYLGYSIAQKDRFTGPDRARHFLDAFRVDALPLGEAVANATPAGPCAGHPGTDSWAESATVEGAVLIGDAAGWSDQLIGQGLSIALRDARSVADVLLDGDDWSEPAFAAYDEERAERMRRIRVAASVMTEVRCNFTPEGRARRATFFGGMMTDPLSLGLVASMLSGPESAGSEVFEDGALERVRAMA